MIFLLHFQTSHYTYLFSFFDRFTLVFANLYYGFHAASNLHYGSRDSFAYDETHYQISIFTLLCGLFLVLVAILSVKVFKCRP